METENDYLKTVNEMKEQFDLKDLEVENEKKKSEFYERELLDCCWLCLAPLDCWRNPIRKITCLLRPC